ncbi:hypothetical protein C8R47DRAFT_1087804 [Mycena vitilis]|nr:hypothetical protein C8R47DRAFT_1087804 [Mycena vitilis]
MPVESDLLHASARRLALSPPNSAIEYDSTVHLPVELLVEIFDMCFPSDIAALSELAENTTPAQEVERLAKRYLLQLSQVCSRWHILVIGTPMLWRTIVVDTGLWSESETNPATLLELLSISLDRGGRHPLTIHVVVEDEESHGTQVLELLTRHSHRWQVAHFWTGFSAFQSIASARGNLPLLETLEIIQSEDWDEFDLFEVAPRLTNFTVKGWGNRVPTVPWSQIRNFSCDIFQPNILAQGLSLLRDDFPTDSRCNLAMSVLAIVWPVEMPSIISNVASLTLTLDVDLFREPAAGVLEIILASLTLPRLCQLGIRSKMDILPLAWSQHHFLAFASRSVLRDSLTALELTWTTIDDDTLTACLSLLPLLEQLIIADCDSEEVPHALITNSLFRRLVWTADPPALVPRLRLLSLTTLLRFSDDAYWDLIMSRLVPARWAGHLFEAKMFYQPGRSRDLPPEFVDKGVRLAAEKEMKFTVRLDAEQTLLDDGLWFHWDRYS